MRVSAVLLILAAALAAQARAPRPAPMQNSAGSAAPSSAAAAPAEPQPIVPSTPANSPPQPPQVTFQNGLLSIRAENSTLADVLTDIRSKTGAQIQVPPGASTQRVVVQEGPAPVRDALVALLQGSGFDYIILGSPQDPAVVQRVLLTPHVANSAAVMQPGYSLQHNDQYPQETDASAEAPPMPPPQPQPVQPNMGQPPAGQGSSGGIKTPEQLLQELQQIRAGQQAQQGQQNGQPTSPQMPPRRVPMTPPN